MGEAVLEGSVVCLGPRAGGVSELTTMGFREVEGVVDGAFEGRGGDVEVRAEVAGFVVGGFDEEAASGGDELVHGRGVSGDDEGSAAHGLDDVVSPAF